jgi:hypothetical protein
MPSWAMARGSTPEGLRSVQGSWGPWRVRLEMPAWRGAAELSLHRAAFREVGESGGTASYFEARKPLRRRLLECVLTPDPLFSGLYRRARIILRQCAVHARASGDDKVWL